MIKWNSDEIEVLRNNFSTIGAKGCAKLINRTEKAIRHRASSLNLELPKITLYPKLQDKEWIYKKYVNQKLNSTQMASEIGCSRNTVLNALRRHNIPRRSLHEAKQLHPGKAGVKHPCLQDKDWLYRRYILQNLNCTQIASQIGCSISGVQSAIKRQGIPLRTLSELHKGKKPTEKSKKKRSKSMKKYYEEHPEERQKRSKNTLKVKSRTKPELTFLELCEKHSLPFKFTGDGSFWIENLNPDFVDCNAKKICVEIFGDYWHSPLLNRNIHYNRTLQGRKEILKKYGWKLIVLWESDLKRPDYEQFVLQKLKKEGVEWKTY